MIIYHLRQKWARVPYLLLLVCLLLPFSSQTMAQETLESSELALSKAVLLYDEKKYGEATQLLLKALRGDPENTTIIYYLGRSYIGQGNLAEAVNVFKRGLQIDPKNQDIQYQLGIAYFNQDAFDEALRQFLAIYDTDPARENIGFYIGFSYFQKKEYAKALSYLQKNVSAEARTRQLATYYTGLALQALGREADAIEELTEAVRIEPTSPLVTSAQQLLRALRVPRPGEKRLFLQTTFNLLYDSNVRGDPRENQGTNLPRRKSMANLINLRGDYFLERSERWENSVTYSFLQTINYGLHDFDIHDHRFQTNFTYKNLTEGGLPYFLGFQANYDILLQGGSRFLQRPGYTLSATLLENAANLTTVFHRFEYKHFFAKVVTPKEDRDAPNYTLGFIHYYRIFGGRHQIHAGYSFDHEDAHGRDSRYTGNKILAGFLIRLPWEIQWNTNFEFHWRDYPQRNSVFNESRQDQQRVWLVSFSKKIAQNLTATFETLYDNNTSEIQNFRSRRSITSVGLTWRY